VTARTSLPGGTSALPTSPFYLNLLPRWLTDDSIPLDLED
jgi:acyl-homoserine lactone acylase PvdQ